MAPNAKIVLVEANSTFNSDLFGSVTVARGVSGVREISMSWGQGEFSGETSYDSYFPQSNGIVLMASTGDTGGATEYPSTSPYVIAVGGTSVATNSAGAFTGETGWSGSGGGTSSTNPSPRTKALSRTHHPSAEFQICLAWPTPARGGAFTTARRTTGPRAGWCTEARVLPRQ